MQHWESSRRERFCLLDYIRLDLVRLECNLLVNWKVSVYQEMREEKKKGGGDGSGMRYADEKTHQVVAYSILAHMK